MRNKRNGTQRENIISNEMKEKYNPGGGEWKSFPSVHYYFPSKENIR